MTTVSDLLSHPGAIVTEDRVWTSCLRCRRTQWLHEAPVSEEVGRRTIYSCADGCGPILELHFGRAPDGDRGHLLRDWMMVNPMPLFLRPLGGDEETVRWPPAGQRG